MTNSIQSSIYNSLSTINNEENSALELLKKSLSICFLATRWTVMLSVDSNLGEVVLDVSYI